MSANDLHTYLTKFVQQQQQQQPGKNSSAAWMDDGEEKANGPASSSAAAAATAASTASSALYATSAALCQKAAQVTLADLEDLVQFADVNGDHRLDLDELMQAYQSFTQPPVAITRERFESAIVRLGMEGARAPPMPSPSPAPSLDRYGLSNYSPTPSAAVAAASSTPATAAASSSHHLLGTGSVLGLTPSGGPSSSSSSPPGASVHSSLPKLPDIFMTASLPVVSAPGGLPSHAPSHPFDGQAAALLEEDGEVL